MEENGTVKYCSGFQTFELQGIFSMLTCLQKNAYRIAVSPLVMRRRLEWGVGTVGQSPYMAFLVQWLLHLLRMHIKAK